MAMKSQQNVREAIQQLVAILVDCGVPKVSSETFRQAKFDKNEAVESFWSLLLHLVQLVRFLNSNEFERLQDITFLKPKPLKVAAMVTRRYMFSLGYYRTEFYLSHLEQVGARELLIAVSWLLQKSKVMLKLVQYHQREAADILIPLSSNRQFLVQQAIEDSETFRSEVAQLLGVLDTGSSLTGATLQQVMEKFVWLKGKLECKWKATLNSHQSFQKMADKIHKSTSSSAVVTSKPPHLTLHEVFLLKHPEQLSAYLKKLEYHTQCLQKLAHWRHYESLFWQWMESVLDLSEKEKEAANEKESNEETAERPSASANDVTNVRELTLKVQRFSTEVEGLLERNQPKIERLNRVWLMKRKTVTAKEIQAAEDRHRNQLGSILLQGSCTKKASNIARHRVESLQDFDHALYLPIDVKKPSKKTLASFPTPGQQEQEIRMKLLQVSREACSELKDEIKRMENGIQERKLDIIRELSRIEHGLPESVCKIESSDAMSR